MINYLNYIAGISQLDPTKIKFMDEAHYNMRDLRKAKVFAPQGSKPVLIDPQKLSDNYSTIVLTSIAPHQDPVYFKLIEPGETNNAIDVFEYDCNLVTQRILEPGDYLVMDNARVHSSIIPDLYDVLSAAGVKLYFLPTYSPELNPCEQAHNQVKKYIRFRRGSSSMRDAIIMGHINITKEFLVKSYKQCFDSIYEY